MQLAVASESWSLQVGLVPISIQMTPCHVLGPPGIVMETFHRRVLAAWPPIRLACLKIHTGRKQFCEFLNYQKVLRLVSDWLHWYLRMVEVSYFP